MQSSYSEALITLSGNQSRDNQNAECIITGVFKDMPSYSTHKFDFVVSFEAFRDRNQWVLEWSNTGPETFVLFKPGADIAAFNQKMADYLPKKSEGVNHRKPFATRYSDLYLYGNFENGVLMGGRIEYVSMFQSSHWSSSLLPVLTL